MKSLDYNVYIKLDKKSPRLLLIDLQTAAASTSGPPRNLPPPPPGSHDIDELLKQLYSISEQSLDEAQQRKQTLYGHCMKNALFSVLCQMKEKLVLTHR